MSPLRPWLRYLGAERRRLLIGSGLLLVTTVSGIGLLALSGWFITASAMAGFLATFGVAIQLNIYAPGGGIRAFAVVRTVSRYFERVANHDAVLRLLAHLRTQVFAALARQPLARLGQLHSSTLLNRLTVDVDSLDNLYLRCLAPALIALLAILLVTLLTGLFAPVLGGLLAVTLLTGAAVIAWLGQRLGRQLGEDLTAARERSRLELMEALQGLAELRAHGLWPQWFDRLQSRLKGLQRLQFRSARLAALAEAASGWLVQIVAVMALAGALALHRQDLIGTAVTTLIPLAVLGLGEALGPVASAFLRLGQTRAAAARLNTQMAPSGAMPDSSRIQMPETAQPLQLDGVTLQYPQALTPVVQHYCLQVAAGQRLAIIGPSGCGKSSLANACAGLMAPASGQITFGGVAIDTIPEQQFHTHLGYLTQQTQLFDDSIAANLRLGRADATDRELHEALARVELAEFVADLDQGLNTWVGENGVRLSGGQARRVGLARLLLHDPSLVVLDEPLTGLDAQTAARVSAHLDRWLVGRTVLMFGHAAEVLPPAERVLPFNVSLD